MRRESIEVDKTPIKPLEVVSSTSCVKSMVKSDFRFSDWIRSASLKHKRDYASFTARGRWNQAVKGTENELIKQKLAFGGG